MFYRTAIRFAETAKRGLSAPITASAPSTCRATFGNGFTGSIAAIYPMGWTAISFGAPSNAPPSLTISSRQAPCQAAQIASGDFPLRVRNLLQLDRQTFHMTSDDRPTSQCDAFGGTV